MIQNVKIFIFGAVAGTCGGYAYGTKYATDNLKKLARKSNEPMIAYRRYAKDSTTKNETVWPNCKDGIPRYYEQIQVINGIVVGAHERF